MSTDSRSGGGAGLGHSASPSFVSRAIEQIGIASPPLGPAPLPRSLEHIPTDLNLSLREELLLLASQGDYSHRKTSLQSLLLQHTELIVKSNEIVGWCVKLIDTCF
jgi:hypothetical protein